MTAIIPFQMLVGPRGAAGYGLQVSAAGRLAEARLELTSLPDEQEALAQTLGAALFPPPVRQMLIEVGRTADEADARVQIQLQIIPPELEDLPWEWATLGDANLWRPAVREDYALVRVGDAVRPLVPMPVVGPLRLLVACAPGAAARAAAPLGHALTAPVRSGDLLVDLLNDSEPAALRAALAEEPSHALHLVVADAFWQDQQPYLDLGEVVDAAGLVQLLGDFKGLRLLTLASGPQADDTALAALAGAVHMQLGIAALALGGLDYAQAATFSGRCYAAIAAGDPIDLAVTDGRATLEASSGSWGAPRLWLAPGAERLFVRRALPAAASVGTTPRQTPSPAADGPGAPVGTPVRPNRAAAAIGRTANRALATARGFVVDATAVGEPAQRSRPSSSRPPWLQPRLIALIIAALVLALMVSRVLPRDEPAPDPQPTSVPTISLPAIPTAPLPAPLPTIAP